jgi:hypothetical protein
MCCCCWSQKFYNCILYVLGSALAILGIVDLFMAIRNRAESAWISDMLRADKSGNLRPIFDTFVTGCLAISVLMIFSGMLVHVVIRMKTNVCTSIYLLVLLLTYMLVMTISSPALLFWGITDKELNMFCDEDFSNVPSG